MAPVQSYEAIDLVARDRVMRHFPSGQLPPSRFRDAKFEELSQALQARGFRCFSSQDFENAMEAKGYPNRVFFGFLEPNEYLFSRSSDKPGSNFFIFVKKADDRLIVSYTNPDSSQAATKLPLHSVYIRREMTEPADSNVPIIVSEIMEYAARKPSDIYMGQLHNHSGYLFEPMTGQMSRLNDDGESDILDFMRAAAYHHLDVCFWTSHNWVGTRNPPGPNLMANAFLREVFGMLGIAAPYSVELSVPLAPGMASGPHTLLAGDWSAMQKIQNEILSKRDPRVQIGSCYMGLDPEEMFAIIEPLRRSKQLILGIPHAWCDSSLAFGAGRILRLESTGWLSAVDTGKIRLDDAINIISHADWVGNFNPSLTTCSLDISNQRLKRFVASLVSKHFPDYALSANTVNLALAQEMAQAYGRNTGFDPDDHRTLPLSFLGADYCVTGQAWGKGHTSITYSKEALDAFAKSGKKPTSEEFIQLLIEGQVKMTGTAFHIPDKKKFPVIVPSRTKIDGRNQVFATIETELSEKQTKGYISEFLETLGSIGEKAFTIINQ